MRVRLCELQQELVKKTKNKNKELGWPDFYHFLQGLSSEERKQILYIVADALLANEAKIRAENEADVEIAQMSGTAKSLIGRLTMKPGKVSFKHFTEEFSQVLEISWSKFMSL